MEVLLEFKICYPSRQSTNSRTLQILGEIPKYFVITTQPWQQQVLKYDDYDENTVVYNSVMFNGKCSLIEDQEQCPYGQMIYPNTFGIGKSTA